MLDWVTYVDETDFVQFYTSGWHLGTASKLEVAFSGLLKHSLEK